MTSQRKDPRTNPDCQCYPNLGAVMVCSTGHMLHCHYPHSCADAGCSHASEASSEYAIPTPGSEARQLAESLSEYISATGVDLDHELYARLLEVDFESGDFRERLTQPQKAAVDAFCAPIAFSGEQSYMSKRMDLTTLAKSLIQYGLQVGHDYALEHGSMTAKKEQDEGDDS